MATKPTSTDLWMIHAYRSTLQMISDTVWHHVTIVHLSARGCSQGGRVQAEPPQRRGNGKMGGLTGLMFGWKSQMWDLQWNPPFLDAGNPKCLVKINMSHEKNRHWWSNFLHLCPWLSHWTSTFGSGISSLPSGWETLVARSQAVDRSSRSVWGQLVHYVFMLEGQYYIDKSGNKYG